MENNIFPHTPAVAANERFSLAGMPPFAVWFTGLSGSGKTTIARELEKRLVKSGRAAYLLDGDSTRRGLCAGLGFTEEDRAENLRRLSEAAAILVSSGTCAIVSAISPLEASRKAARERLSDLCDFFEVYISTPAEECMRRDVKGLYAKAKSGEIKNFTGVGAGYEVPENPDITIDTTGRSVSDCVDGILLMIWKKQFLDGISDIAVKAGEEIMKVYSGDFGVEFKADSSPLTEADKRSNEVIVSYLRQKWENIPVLSEESADSEDRLFSQSCFIVDPLDGTKEFVKRNGEFTVNIAVALRGRSVMGVIYVPVTRELYFAASGAGAYKCTVSESGVIGTSGRLHTSDRTDDLILMESRSHSSDDEQEKLLCSYGGRITQRISAGSSLKGCRIAEGRADLYYRSGLTSEWDTAAMQCICEEAGGIFRRYDGKEMRYNRRDTLNREGFYILNSPANELEKENTRND